MNKKYVKNNTATLYDPAVPEKKLYQLLWGDHFIVESGPVNGMWTGHARGKRGLVKDDDLGDESLLEFYFIDVLARAGDFRDSRYRISIQSVHPALVPGSREI